MVFFNHATRQMTAKIVYYGPGLCGKTTNLNTIYGKTSQKSRGEMVSLNTETDRTLFFDLLPLDVGTIGGFKTKLQLYTVPGQVFYNATRKLVLKGVDGIVFVADSQLPMQEANRESLQNLRENLLELGIDLAEVPLVFQWNKRDLKAITAVETLEAELNPGGAPSFEAIASEESGVFETLRGITRMALAGIKAKHMGDGAENRSAGSASRLPGLPAIPKVNGHASSQAPFLKSPAPRVAVPHVAIPRIKAPAVAPTAVPRPHLPSLRALAAPTATLEGLQVALEGQVEPAEMEIRVQVVQDGRVVGEAEMRRLAPAPGETLRIPLEVRRG
nr:hypothetical protein [uncultured Holophaga sp.]